MGLIGFPDPKPEGAQVRILLIEDDSMVGAGLLQALRDHGMTVDWVQNGADAEPAIEGAPYALILLDLNLPGKPGLEILRDLRRRSLTTPILVLTARDGIGDRVEGLDLGADDYIVKPFEVGELLARIRAVLRRQRGHANSIIGNGRLTLDLASHEATFDGARAVLPAREFALLHALLERPGTILMRAQLEDRIYGWGEEVESNAIDALIYSVRKKLGKDVIRNLRGAGWLVDRSDT
jgi:DNA-binding response OmpR family regulator